METTTALPEEPNAGTTQQTTDQVDQKTPHKPDLNSLFKKGEDHGFKKAEKLYKQKLAEAGIDPEDIEGSIASFAQNLTQSQEPVKPAKGKTTLDQLQEQIANERKKFAEEKQQFIRQQEEERIRGDIRFAVSGFGTPHNMEETVYWFQRNHQFERQGETLLVKNGRGEVVLNQDGSYATVNQAFRTWANDGNLHRFKASGSGGVGITSAGGGAKFDLKRFEAGDVEYIRKHKKDFEEYQRTQSGKT